MEKNFRCDLIQVRDAGIGGRLYSAFCDFEGGYVPNGMIFNQMTNIDAEGTEEIKVLKLDEEKDWSEMFIVMKPEINPNEYLRSNARLGKHLNMMSEASLKPVPVVQLHLGDIIALTSDYMTDGYEAPLGYVYQPNYGDGSLGYATKRGLGLKLIEIKDADSQGLVFRNGQYELQGYEMLIFEVVRAIGEA